MKLLGRGAPVPFGGSRCRRGRGSAAVPFGGSRKRRGCRRRCGGSIGTALLLANALKSAKNKSQIATGRRRRRSRR